MTKNSINKQKKGKRRNAIFSRIMGGARARRGEGVNLPICKSKQFYPKITTCG